MVIRALDIVARCDTAEDGRAVGNSLREQLAHGTLVEFSFDGVFDVPSSFVNTAIVPLFIEFGSDFVRSHLKITDATRQIADMIRRCVANGTRGTGVFRQAG